MDNQLQIRDAATRLFARQGFSATSLQSIASEVGISKPTLLYHYESKETLRSAVLENLFAHWRHTLPQVLAAVTSGHGRFEALTDELLRFFVEDPDRARLIGRELLDRPDELRMIMTENLRPWMLLVSEYIHEGQEGGMLYDDVDAESYILHVVTLAISAVANLPILTSLMTLDGEGPGALEERHLGELRRLVRTGLFRDRKEDS